jgi:uroporphyrinogen decarboxylase
LENPSTAGREKGDSLSARRNCLSQKVETKESHDPLLNSPFMRACRREPVPHTPVWLMRQAGRYMKEYREVRARHTFLEMCKKPEVAAEVTVYAAERLRVDAAIIFADILLILEPMGINLEFAKGEGPVIHNPVRTGADVERLNEVEDVEALGYVFEAIRLTRRALPANIPLIGFSGAPFTLASYMTEGGGSKNYIHTKRMMYMDAGRWHEMMSLIARALPLYLNAQIEAGAQAVQLFDSWVGCLSPDDYREYVLPHTREVIRNITPGVPVIHFGTGTATLLELMREAGGDVIGLDWRVRLDEAWAQLGDVAVMGNLDPISLFTDAAFVRAQAKRILDQAAGRPGHIFNLGHGILPETPVENVVALVEAVHEFSHRPSFNQ